MTNPTGPRSQIPLNRALVDPKGLITVPWSFWFQSLNASLPPGGSGYVVDGSAASVTMTMFQGPDSGKGTPQPGYIYFALDTGKTYVTVGNQWVLQDPAYVGDVTKPANSQTLTLQNVFPSPGTYGSSNLTPVLTVDSKGRITNLSFQQIVATPNPAGNANELQYNNNGVLGGTGGITYAPSTQSLFVLGNIVANNLIGNHIGNITGNITANTANINVLNANTITANIGNINTINGNTINGNIINGNTISATGNITGNYFIGNGSQLTGIIIPTGNSISNGTSNINIPVANGNITFGVNGTSNVIVIGNTIVDITGNVSADYVLANNANISNNINLGNGIGGTLSGANLVSANFLQGNITGNVGNIANLSVTGNLTIPTSLTQLGNAPITATDTTIAFKIPITINGNVYYIALTAAQ